MSRSSMASGRASSRDRERRTTLGKSGKSATLERGGAGSGAGSGVVLCDICTVNKRRAAKSCLSCLASYCEGHLQPHYEYPALMKHKLVGPAGQVQEKICPNHDRLLEAYCRTDQQSVCVLCMVDEHKNHETVSAATERTDRQKQLGATLLKSQHRIQGRLKKWQDLKQALVAVKHSAQTAVEENERIFTELVRAVQRWHTEVKQQILARERAEVTRGTALLRQLEEEVAELRRRHLQLEELSHSDDHIHFLQSWQLLSSPSGYEDVSSINVDTRSSFGPTKKAISDLRERLEDTCKAELVKISATVREVTVLQADEPRTREDFLHYSCELKLDPNTVHRGLRVLEGGGGVEMVSEPLPYPEHPGRFAHWQQVLCREGLSGRRCYWEVDWKGTEVDIAVSYKGISRKSSSNECNFGWNNRSWSLYLSESKCAFVHNNSSTTVPFPSSSRIGVFLDFQSGILSFYSVSDTMTLLHKAHTSFLEAVYPGFGVWGFGSTIKIV